MNCTHAPTRLKHIAGVKITYRSFPCDYSVHRTLRFQPLLICILVTWTYKTNIRRLHYVYMSSQPKYSISRVSVIRSNTIFPSSSRLFTIIPHVSMMPMSKIGFFKFSKHFNISLWSWFFIHSEQLDSCPIFSCGSLHSLLGHFFVSCYVVHCT